MRILIVDQDSALLTAISRTLGAYFTIDAVTNKSDCLGLVGINDFDVIVAGERLEDGSGLELLGQLARNHPDMLRIFAAERERLKLLQGRLGPFGLFRTLSYPIEPRQLLAALSAAVGVDEEAAVAAAPIPQPVAKAAVAARRPAHATVPQRTPRQPTPRALAAAHRLDVVARAKDFPPPGEPTPARSAFLVGAGVVLALGGMLLAVQISNTADEPIPMARTAPRRSPHFPPEVVKLVADTETAFQQDDYKHAHTDVAALQQIAPDHPRLPFFESLLQRLEARTGSGTKPSTRLFSRHTSAPAPAAPPAAASRTFSGRTLEEAPNDIPARQSPAILALGAPIAGSTDIVEQQLIQRVNPEYPPEAQRRGIEGSVEVSFTVSPEGKVSDVIVVGAEPSDIFDRAAVDAVRRWRYEPQKVGGVPVEAHLQTRVQFKLDARAR